MTSNNDNKKIFSKIWKIVLLVLGVGGLVYRNRKIVQEVLTEHKDYIVHILEQQYESYKVKGRSARFKQILMDYFIPHSGNDHKPKALDSKALRIYAIVLVIIKLVVVGALFFTYPNPARLSQKITEGVFALTNSTRSIENISQLRFNQALSNAAQAKANDMIASNYFSHIGPDGKKPWQWINRGEYNFLYMGENLAMDFSSAEIVHSAFLNSPSHRKNILNDKYTDMGIGVATGEIDGRETMVLVEFFGTAKEVTPPTAVVVAAEVPVLAVTAPVSEPAVSVPEAQITEPEVQVPVAESRSNEPEPVSESAVSMPSQPEQDIPAPTQVAQTEPGIDTSVLGITSSDDKPVIGPEEIVLEAANEPDPTELAAEIIPEVFTAASEPTLISTESSVIQKDMVDYLIIFSRYIFLLFLVTLLVSLLINIFVKVHIQHASVIVQCLAVTVLVASFLLVRFHFVESFTNVIIF